MTEPREQVATARTESRERGGALVVAALALALFNFAGDDAVGILLFAALAWNVASGSRVANWLTGIVSLAWGLVQLGDIMKGHYGDKYLSEWILIWARCLCGFAVPLILWLHKDVRSYLRAARVSEDGDGRSPHPGR